MLTSRLGNAIHTAGHLPMKSDGTLITGTVGKDLSAEEAHKAAEWVGLNLLSTIRAEIGSLDKVGLYTHANSVSQEMQGLSLLYFLTCFIFFLRFCLHFFLFFFKSLTYLLPSILCQNVLLYRKPKTKTKGQKGSQVGWICELHR